MSAQKDLNKFLRHLQLKGWVLEHAGKVTHAKHPQGGEIEVMRNHPSIHRARTAAQRIDDHHAAEKKRLKLLQQNTRHKPAPKPPVTTTKGSKPMGIPVNDHDKKKHEDALLDLLVEHNTKLNAVGSALVTLSGAVARTGNMVEDLVARLKAEDAKRTDAEAYHRRMAYLDELLKDLEKKYAKVLTFETEAELVATVSLVTSYGRAHDKEFRTSRENLDVNVWRTR